MWNRHLTYVIGLILFTVTICQAQVDTSPIMKGGGMIYFWSDGYALSFEREKVFVSAQAFSHGLRLDFDGGVNNLTPGYQFKFYPFHFISKKPYKGFYLGGAPC